MIIIYQTLYLKVADLFLTHPEIVWITGNYQIIDENKKTIEPFVVTYKNYFRKRSNSHRLRLTNYIIHQYLLAEKG